MSSRTRNELLIDLADTINGLTEVRTHSEPYEAREGGKRVMRRHIETFPSLLVSLQDAMQPAATGDATAAGFESRPSAELEPIAVIALITDQAGTYLRAAGGKPKHTLAGTLHSLVGAQLTDTQLENLCRDAHTWLHRANLATGWETASFTLNQPCPYCTAKFKLVVSGDMQRAYCRGCNFQWDEQTIGLLGQMVEQNTTETTLSADRCWQDECTAYGPHDTHRDHRGRTWGDTCTVSDLDGRIGA